MRTNYQLPHLASSLQLTDTDRRKRSCGQTGGAALLSALQSVIRRGAGVISCWRRRRIAIGKLQALNDHYLRDIGLHRSQIVSSVEENIRTGGKAE